jgi:hypothetical protein
MFHKMAGTARFGGLLQNRLHGRAERIPQLLLDEQWGTRVKMLGNGYVLLHLEKALGFDDGKGVFLSVDGFGLERGIHFPDGHGGGISAPVGNGRHMDRRFHDAELFARDIRRGIDGAYVIREISEATLHRGKAHHAFALKQYRQLLPMSPSAGEACSRLLKVRQSEKWHLRLKLVSWESRGQEPYRWSQLMPSIISRSEPRDDDGLYFILNLARSFFQIS